MTMMTASHPDDERLAALSAGDRDAVDDRALREHITGAELPDLTPSRPLRLLPPAAEVGSRDRMPWLRRLVAPTLAAGIGLVLVGGVGSAGLFGVAGGAFSLSAEGAGSSPRASDLDMRPAAQDSSSERPAPSPTAPTGAYVDGVSPIPTRSAVGSSPVPTASSADSNEVPGAAGGPGEKAVSPETLPIPPSTWLLVLGAGIGLIGIGLGLRFSLQPRAG